MWTRLKALIVKELLAVLRDPKSRTIIIVPPLIQLLVFSYAATLEVKNVDLLALNHDSGHWSQELIERIEGAPTFRHVTIAESEAQVRRTIDMHQAIGAVVIGPTFSRDIACGRRRRPAGHSRRAAIERGADRRRLSRPRSPRAWRGTPPPPAARGRRRR